MFRTIACLSAVVLAICGVPVTAAAQTEKGNIAVSYSYLHDPDLNLPIGWLFAATGNLTRNLGIVGEIGGNYKTEDLGGENLHLRIHSFLGGVKVQGAASSKVVPFAQVLVGETRVSASLLGENQSDHVFAVQPGAGVDIKITRNAGIRVQGDFRNNRANGDTFNQFRFAVGGVFAFGRK